MVEKKISINLPFVTNSITCLPGKIFAEKTCRSLGPLRNLGRFTVQNYKLLNQMFTFVGIPLECYTIGAGGRWRRVDGDFNDRKSRQRKLRKQ